MKDFYEWIEDNVITFDDKNGNEFFSTQDANYRNAIYGIESLFEYYEKMIIF